ncbi:MAG: gliding motility-associated C-terminal domain-containing protein [Chitinophagaceae bacterium]|nr:gliding motility-associated C-terminal domain-containing protein [Chitinophagaceae bacterium]
MGYDSVTVHPYLLPGNFVPSVVLKDTNGCVVTIIGTDTIKLYSSKVNFGASDTAFCDIGTVNFFDSSFSGSNTSSYKWDFGDGNFSSLQNPTHFYNNPERYPVKLIITTVNGCQDSLVKLNYIKVARTPQISIAGNNTNYCGSSIITMQGNWLNADTSAINWSWNFSNGNLSSVQNPLPQQYIDTGNYTVQLIAVNRTGCADTANTTITIYPVPNTFAGNDTAICAGNTAQLNAAGADSYSWQPAAFLSCINCSSPVTSIQNSGSYYVKGINISGCEKTDTIFITVKQPFHITGLQPNDSVCAGKTIQLNVSGAENYFWSPVAGLNNSTINNPTANPAVNTTYKVIGSDNINCFKDSATIFIKVNSIPSVNAGTDIILNSGRSVTLNPQYSNDISNWLWQPATGLSCINCPNPVASPSNGINYKITVTNSSGCTDDDEISVQVNCNKHSVFLPTAYTPNNDSQNDIFYPLNPAGTGAIKINTFKIFNRYGQLVFENENFYSNNKVNGWDGKMSGRDCPTGTYLYSITFTCTDNKLVTFDGNILLLR